ncbi:uncharacterized protein SPSC_04518 [Sporisorium scitamineum]|uniref:Uncharacterized protein n=1 Tax=Sporisorium scitamineum TaxID=49012 RepID=A0A0F7RSL6_9BASI|nr:hypothetical protein [Sporisorium scitamineum]CDU24685.1 uncharacterized protein SPSC_04518 [Sporisorium scitamineum]
MKLKISFVVLALASSALTLAAPLPQPVGGGVFGKLGSASGRIFGKSPSSRRLVDSSSRELPSAKSSDLAEETESIGSGSEHDASRPPHYSGPGSGPAAHSGYGGYPAQTQPHYGMQKLTPDGSGEHPPARAADEYAPSYGSSLYPSAHSYPKLGDSSYPAVHSSPHYGGGGGVGSSYAPGSHIYPGGQHTAAPDYYLPASSGHDYFGTSPPKSEEPASPWYSFFSESHYPYRGESYPAFLPEHHWQHGESGPPGEKVPGLYNPRLVETVHHDYEGFGWESRRN